MVALTYVPHASSTVSELEVGEGLILYEESADLVHQLNPSAGLIWRLCDGTATVGQLASEIANEYGLDLEEVRAQVATLVGEFDALGLVNGRSSDPADE